MNLFRTHYDAMKNYVAYLKRLLENNRVMRHLREHHGEPLPEFEAIVAAETV